jgi:UDP-3-O-[3-hydroxymyristoyl] N-acetylglucosamine deacetylase
MDESRVLNRDGLRWTDEFVRHKVLDLIGDLALIGMPIEGHIVVERGGHALHQQLITEILKRPEAWRIEGPVVPTRGAPDLASLQASAEASA